MNCMLRRQLLCAGSWLWTSKSAKPDAPTYAENITMNSKKRPKRTEHSKNGDTEHQAKFVDDTEI
mgnify:CR=1 FL=1